MVIGADDDGLFEDVEEVRGLCFTDRRGLAFGGVQGVRSRSGVFLVVLEDEVVEEVSDAAEQ